MRFQRNHTRQMGRSIALAGDYNMQDSGMMPPPISTISNFCRILHIRSVEDSPSNLAKSRAWPPRLHGDACEARAPRRPLLLCDVFPRALGARRGPALRARRWPCACAGPRAPSRGAGSRAPFRQLVQVEPREVL
jgi:hypothetical protein